ncbi:chemotaxis protein CheW [Novosphingobium lentum]|uniref:chemotaxis protein CheW n=1 Tax=Novosphingobium lentum TaxID=145287 RepID=UPI00082A3A0C|nr:chemotaxis protein CheW [Novosphingobium lentum]
MLEAADGDTPFGTDEAPTMNADATDPARGLFGLIRLAGLCVAIPAIAIREVVPCPATLDRFPATRPDVVGAIDLRGQLIPVLDLTRALAASTAVTVDAAAPIAVILRHEGKVFGVLAEGIEGVSLIDDSAIGALSIGAALSCENTTARPLVSSTFHQGDRRGMLLGLDAVCGLPGLPRSDDRAGQHNRARMVDEPTLVFTLNDLRCALPTGCVDATLPWQDLVPAPVEDSLWIAMLPYKGADIPVVDTVALLGHGAMEPGRRRGAAIVLRTTPPQASESTGAGPGFGLVALLIDSVDDIVRFDADAVTLLPQGTPGTRFARGLVQRGEGSCLLLDAERLKQDARLCQLGTIEQRPGTGASKGALSAASVSAQCTKVTTTAEPAEGAEGADARKPYLVFGLGDCDFSVPLDIVDEILPASLDVVPLPDGGTGMIGLFSRRGLAVPLIDLGSHLHIPGAAEGRFVVVARFMRGAEILRAGFRVDALRSVERAVVQRLKPLSRDKADRRTPHNMMERTIRIDNGSTCCVLDLAEMAHALVLSGHA